MYYLETDLTLSPITIERLTSTIWRVTIGSRVAALRVSHGPGCVGVWGGDGLVASYPIDSFSELDLAEAACTCLGIPATIVPPEGDDT